MSEPVIVRSKQTVTVEEMRALGENAPAALRTIEAKVEDDFADEIKRMGITVDGVNFVWECHMVAHGVDVPGRGYVP